MEDQSLGFTFSWLLLLPVIAAVLIFQGTWLDDGKSVKGRPKKYQRRLRAKVLIHRTLIVNLFLATFFVYTSSVTMFPDVAQGLILTVILMLPVFAYILIAVFGWPRTKQTKPTTPAKRSSDIGQGRSESTTQIKNTLTAESKLLAADKANSKTDQNSIAVESNRELTTLVASLLNDKKKLEKLVMAQRTVINTERQRLKKAQTLTKNALLVMCKTREGAKVAIRVAKSERRERLRLEAANAKEGRHSESVLPARPVKKTANF